MWITEHAQGAVIQVLVVPRASRTRVVGIHDDRLKVQLAAPPVDGAANVALVEFVAEELGLRRSEVELIAGQTSRRKTLLVVDMSPDKIKDALGLT